jgi:hypothetical protein
MVARWFYLQAKNPYFDMGILEGLAMRHFGMFYGHLVYVFYAQLLNSVIIFCILWYFLVYFSQFWYVAPRKIWQPWL